MSAIVAYGLSGMARSYQAGSCECTAHGVIAPIRPPPKLCLRVFVPSGRHDSLHNPDLLQSTQGLPVQNLLFGPTGSSAERAGTRAVLCGEGPPPPGRAITKDQPHLVAG